MLKDNQEVLIRHLIRFHILDYESCLQCWIQRTQAIKWRCLMYSGHLPNRNILSKIKTVLYPS